MTHLFSHSADCAAMQWRLALPKLQPVINLHIIYVFPNQCTGNLNPKITPTWTGKPLPLSNLNIFLPHPPILIWHNDDARFMYVSKIRYVWVCNTQLTFQRSFFVQPCRHTLACFHKIQIKHTHTQTIQLSAFVRIRKYSNLFCNSMPVF